MLLNSKNLIQTEDFPNKDTFDKLKGFFAVCVLLHHFTQYTDAFSKVFYPLWWVLQLLGTWSVGIFLFMSGYGLMSSVSAGKGKYIRTFPRKRILPFYVMCVLAVVTYLIMDICIGRTVDIWLVIKSLTFGGTLVTNGWYLQTMLFLYIVFYLVFRLIPNEKKALIAMTLVSVLYIMYSAIMSDNATRTVGIPMFILGMILSFNKEKVYRAWEKVWIWLTLSGFVILAATMKISIMVHGYLYTAVMLVSVLAFIVFIMGLTYLIIRKAPAMLINPVFGFYGKMSLEMYIFQGLFLVNFQFLWTEKGKKIPYFFILIIGTTLTAFMVSVIKKKIRLKGKRV